MPRPSIDYLNARREHLRSRNGGSHQDYSAKYAPDYEPDAFEIAMSTINNFALWAEASRHAYLKAIGLNLEPETIDEIPF